MDELDGLMLFETFEDNVKIPLTGNDSIDAMGMAFMSGFVDKNNELIEPSLKETKMVVLENEHKKKRTKITVTTKDVDEYGCNHFYEDLIKDITDKNLIDKVIKYPKDNPNLTPLVNEITYRIKHPQLSIK